LRDAGTRTVRFLIVSNDEASQFDLIWANSDLLVADLGVLVRHISIAGALDLSDSALASFDVIGVQFPFFTPTDEVESVIDCLRARAAFHSRFVYFDGDDDLGILWPQLLKKVDLYVKNHLFADRSRYLEGPTIGKSNLTDYVATHHGTSFDSDPIPRSVVVADKADMGKLFLGWNLGGARAIFRQLKKFERARWPRRDIDVSCRVSIPPGGWIAPLRMTAIQQLELLGGEFRVIATTDRIPPTEYQAELRRSRICVSPFGHGEVCFRDFEAILHGCLLIKPDMSHIETQPDVYIPWETYVPVQWDFSDLADACRFYLQDDRERSRIATRAFAVLHEFYKNQVFVDIFANLLERLDLRSVPWRNHSTPLIGDH
jgi:hypothetical protein